MFCVNYARIMKVHSLTNEITFEQQKMHKFTPKDVNKPQSIVF